MTAPASSPWQFGLNKLLVISSVAPLIIALGWAFRWFLLVIAIAYAIVLITRITMFRSLKVVSLVVDLEFWSRPKIQTWLRTALMSCFLVGTGILTLLIGRESARNDLGKKRLEVEAMGDESHDPKAGKTSKDDSRPIYEGIDAGMKADELEHHMRIQELF